MDQSRVAVFGTGVMGYGIALLCLGRGLSVVVLSGSPDRAGALVERLHRDEPEAGGELTTDVAALPEPWQPLDRLASNT